MKLMRNQELGHIDFNAFQGLNPTKPLVLPMDLDMIYELNGKFLVAEWKRPKEEVSTGQKILLQQLAKKDDFQVLIIYGHTDEDTVVEKFFEVRKDGTCQHLGTGLDYLKTWITMWMVRVQ